ncbi:MAG TPA: peptidylprolyl isomerase [Magnetospirillaceae bacterium]|nr:peptidylprolyl isomerase [Magnetospirillaceae bacterium]
MKRSAALLLTALCALPALAKTPAEILKDSPATDWRPLDPDNTLVMDVGGHQVILELAPRFAPKHVANIRTLAHEGYYDNLAVVRVQDNFVTQWGDPNEDDATKKKPLGSAAAHLPAEFAIPYKGLPIAKLKDPDGWAPVSGWVDGFPVAADPKQDKAWLTHCYGVVGAGRDMAIDSSTGAELYAIIGQSPRMLDLNITVVGRVLRGMEYLSALPRGSAAMGMYDKPEQFVTIKSVKLAADLPADQRPKMEILKTGSKTWKDYLETRRNPPDDFHVYKANFTNVCNVTVPIR